MTPTFTRLPPQRIPRRGGRAWKNEAQRKAAMAAMHDRGGQKTPIGTSSSHSEVFGVGRGRAFRKTGEQRKEFLESLAPTRATRYYSAEANRILRAGKKLSGTESTDLNQKLVAEQQANLYRPVTVGGNGPGYRRAALIAAGVAGLGLGAFAIAHPGVARWAGRRLGKTRHPLAALRGVTQTARAATSLEAKEAGKRWNRYLIQRIGRKIQGASDWLTGYMPGERLAGARATRVELGAAIKERQASELGEFMRDVRGIGESEATYGYQPGAIDRLDRSLKRLVHPLFRKARIDFDPDYMYRFGRQGRVPDFGEQLEGKAASVMSQKPGRALGGSNKSRSVVESGPNASKFDLARGLVSPRHVQPKGPEVWLDPKGYRRRRRRLVLPNAPTPKGLLAPDVDILNRPYRAYTPSGPVKNPRKSSVEIYRELLREGVDPGRAMQMASERAR